MSKPFQTTSVATEKGNILVSSRQRCGLLPEESEQSTLVGLRHMFRPYLAGWTSLNSELIASHYKMPASIINRQGKSTCTCRADLLTSYDQLVSAYADLEIDKVDFAIESVIQNSDNVATVGLVWRLNSQKKSLEFLTTYVCVEEAGQWYIISTVDHSPAHFF